MHVTHVEKSKSKLRERHWEFYVHCDHSSKKGVSVILETYALYAKESPRHKLRYVEYWSRLRIGRQPMHPVERPTVPQKVLDIIKQKVIDSIHFEGQL